MINAVQLTTYVDRLGQDLAGLDALLSNEFAGLFSAVHLLPFFDPIDGADAGFDPSDHTAVDPRLGQWQDVRAISSHTSVMADLIVNHISSASVQFEDVMHRGKQSDNWNLFLKPNDVFPEGASAENIDEIYRPRPGAPFTPITLNNGDTHKFWTTFNSKQLDINVETTQGRDYLISILQTFANAGVNSIRLDAAGYAIKRRGTSCFMLPETFTFIDSLSEAARNLRMDVLVEIHSHYQTQIDMASRALWVYDFALPPLVLHTLFTEDATPLKNWLAISPRNCITVLDTHDGIGIVDVAGAPGRAGLLEDDDVERLVEQMDQRSKGSSTLASGHAASNLDIYQVNTTYYDALGRSDRLYLLARAIQLFAPGVPQIYYVGLLAGENDMELLKKTGVGRDINRHYFTLAEIHSAMERPVVKSLCNLIRIRNTAAAFRGQFSLVPCADNEIRMRWESNGGTAEFVADFKKQCGSITIDDKDVITQYQLTEILRRKGP